MTLYWHIFNWTSSMGIHVGLVPNDVIMWYSSHGLIDLAWILF